MMRGYALAAFAVFAPPAAVIAAAALWSAGVAPSRTDLIVLAVGAPATILGVELGFHRYFAHRSFTARPALIWVLGALGSSAFLGPVMWWVAMHRRHHALTDREGDPHSPHWPFSGLHGLVHAHVGWLFSPEHTAMTISAGEVKDLWQSPRAVALHRSYLWWGMLGLVVPALIGFAAGGARGALTGFLWGGMIRVFAVSQVTWAVNSFGHAFGGAAQSPHSGQARNNMWLAVPALGGGNHANHHDSPRAYTTRMRRWQIDVGGAVLRVLSACGLVRDLKQLSKTES